MHPITSIHRCSALLALVTFAACATARADEPQGSPAPPAVARGTESPARSETDKAIASQQAAVAKAGEILAACTRNLARYQGQPSEPRPIDRKLRSIIFPSIRCYNSSMEEMAEYLRQQSVEMDAAEVDPAKKGVKFLIHPRTQYPYELPDGIRAVVPCIWVKNVSGARLLGYFCKATGWVGWVEEDAVHFSIPTIFPQRPTPDPAAGIQIPKPQPNPFLELTVEQLETRAADCFGSKETANAIAFQMMAVDKAEDVLARQKELLARCQGRIAPDPTGLKLRSIILPSFECAESRFEEIVYALAEQCQKLDATESDPLKKGVSFVVTPLKWIYDPAPGGLDAPPYVIRPVKLPPLKNVSAAAVLKAVCEAGEASYKIIDGVVIITDK